MMKEYLLIAKGSQSPWKKMTAEESKELDRKFSEWISSLEKRKLWIRGDALTSKRVDISQSGSVNDGPFTETKEVMTGFFLFKAEDMTEATEIARGCPVRLYDAVELRELEGDR